MNDPKAHVHEYQQTNVHHDHGQHHSDDHDHTNDYDNEFDIYPQEFLKILKDGLSCNSKIIDVREAWEFEEVKIEGSLFIPLQQLYRQSKELSTEYIYYVICSQGFRSSYATAYMLSLGYENVYNIQTGLIGIIEYLAQQKLSHPVWLIKESK